MRGPLTRSRPGGSVRVVTDGYQRARSNVVSCLVGSEIVVNYRALEDFHFQRLTPIQFDFALLTGVVAYVDRLFVRRQSEGWQRDLRVLFPVHAPDTWMRSCVSEALRDCLAFLTGDNWWFEFVPRTTPDEWLQRQQFLDLRAFQPTHVIPFSGGMTRCTNETDKSYAVHAVKDQASLATLASNPWEGWSRLPAEELSYALNLNIDDTRLRIEKLVAQHAREWRGFLADVPADAWVRTVAECWHD